MKKKLFKNKKGELHFGANAPDGFTQTDKKHLKEVLAELVGKKLWRCNVCNDLHIGIRPPKECPTCHTIEAFVEINEKEFLTVLNTLI